MSYIKVFGQIKHFFNNLPASAGQIVTIEMILDDESTNDFDGDAVYLVEKYSVVLKENGYLPDTDNGDAEDLLLWCNVNSKYRFGTPDNKTWEAIVSYGDGSPKNITEIRAGGIEVETPDTILSLIEENIAGKADKLGTNETVSGTSYTLQAGDLGKVKRFTNNAAVSLTIPLNLPHGFNCAVIQTGDGQVTFVGAVGVILDNPLDHTKSIKNGMVTIYSYAADGFIFQGATE